MREIIIPNNKSDALPQQLQALYGCFKGIGVNERVKFNLKELTWVSPLVILPLCAYAYSTKSQIEYGNTAIKDYLDSINFPCGVDTISAFEEQTQRFKNFVPISILRKQAREQRERLEALFLEMTYKILANTKGAENAIYYPMGEFVSNIFDHSKKDEGFVFGQHYASKKFLDMCIVDCGRGLKSAYKEELGIDLSDEAAINNALEGYSTKADRERGYGIRSSIKVVCQGLNGGFILISGNSAFISIGTKQAAVSLPDFHWQGVIIAYRVPRPTAPVDISPYIE